MSKAREEPTRRAAVRHGEGVVRAVSVAEGWPGPLSRRERWGRGVVEALMCRSVEAADAVAMSSANAPRGQMCVSWAAEEERLRFGGSDIVLEEKERERGEVWDVKMRAIWWRRGKKGERRRVRVKVRGGWTRRKRSS